MANLNLNKVILAGRLTADPELKKTQMNDTSVCSFTIAVNRRFTKQGDQPQADFINCVAWRQQAELLSRYFRKGSSVCIVGNIQNRSWTDQQGNKRYTTEVIVDELNFVDSKGEGPNREFSQEAPVQTPAYSTAPQEMTQFDEADEDDLPF